MKMTKCMLTEQQLENSLENAETIMSRYREKKRRIHCAVITHSIKFTAMLHETQSCHNRTREKC